MSRGDHRQCPRDGTFEVNDETVGGGQMSRIGLQAIAATVLIALTGVPSSADADPALSDLFENDALPSVDAAELAEATGRGLANDSSSIDGGSQSRVAVILWDETKPPVSANNGLSGVQQAAGHIVISVGAGPAGGP